jgi:DNA-binding NtrC family response regulator
MNTPILVVDDDKSMCELLADGLAEHGFEVTYRTTPKEALALADQREFDAVLTDIHMPGMDGLELCHALLTARPTVPVLVITAFGTLEFAIRAIRAGAYDLLTKPLDIEVVVLALNRALGHRALREEVRQLRRLVEEERRYGEIVGASPPMRIIYETIERAAPTDATILLTGETGTGKEVVARSIHHRSRRAAGPFVALNCAAMAESLLESELFGHVRGAFTDARAARPGLFSQASGGTLFLDEIGEMPLSLQPKLLRTLQERAIRPVGADQEVPVDVRLIAATHRDLESAVEDGRFREDLFYRLNVIHMDLPALRSRGGDIVLLAETFLTSLREKTGRRVLGFSRDATELLMAYPWPGNVRELQNCVERAVVLARTDLVGVDDLPEKVRGYRPSHVVVASSDPNELLSLEEVERNYILRVLDLLGGNKTRAAQILGLDRKTLYRKMEQYRVADAAEKSSVKPQ